MIRDSNPNLNTTSELELRFIAITSKMKEKIVETKKKKTFSSPDEFYKEFLDLANNDKI